MGHCRLVLLGAMWGHCRCPAAGLTPASASFPADAAQKALSLREQQVKETTKDGAKADKERSVLLAPGRGGRACGQPAPCLRMSSPCP
jgi:hypothetical protein